MPYLKILTPSIMLCSTSKVRYFILDIVCALCMLGVGAIFLLGVF